MTRSSNQQVLLWQMGNRMDRYKAASNGEVRRKLQGIPTISAGRRIVLLPHSFRPALFG